MSYHGLVPLMFAQNLCIRCSMMVKYSEIKKTYFKGCKQGYVMIFLAICRVSDLKIIVQLCFNLCLCAEVRKPGHHTGVWSGVTVNQTSRHYSSVSCEGKRKKINPFFVKLQQLLL